MAIDKVDKLLLAAEKAIPQSLMPDLPRNEYSDQPEWYGFEDAIWRLGADIQMFLSENKSYLLNDSQIQRIIEISTNANAKRGRQSFIMLLGHKRYSQYSERIVSQIYDSDVEGHVIGTLLKMQSPGYAKIIRPYTDNQFAWIRNKAKKYIEKYD